jgi:hypothetical protein
MAMKVIAPQIGPTSPFMLARVSVNVLLSRSPHHALLKG